jgi:hypothetical protein
MISRLTLDLNNTGALVTYNGSTFDVPLYRTRCVMNGIPPPELAIHIDLLAPARRLWRGILEDCTLRTIERQILHVDRGPDIPGSAIPERWFSFLRQGSSGFQNMDVVFSHNDQDVRTLAQLLITIRNGLDQGRLENANPAGLAVLAGRSDAAQAVRILQEALSNGDSRAVKPLMHAYWQQGKRQERMNLIPALPEDAYGFYMKSIHAEKIENNLELATFYAKKAHKLASGLKAIRIAQRVDKLYFFPAWVAGRADLPTGFQGITFT